jgi:hypothetical protein
LTPGVDAGKEGSPRLTKAAFLSQGGLLCTPEAAEAAVLCQAGLRMASERLCMPPPKHAGGGQPEAAVQGQAGLCLHSGGDAGKEGSPRLPKAAVLCQGELLCTPEAAEAVLCQARLLCTPEAAEAAVLCQAGLRMASERLCMPPPGHAGGGQPVAAVQGQGRLRMASENLCIPPPGGRVTLDQQSAADLDGADMVRRRSRLPIQTAFVKADCWSAADLGGSDMSQVPAGGVPGGRGPASWRRNWLPYEKKMRRRRMSDGTGGLASSKQPHPSTPPSLGGGRGQASAGAGGQDPKMAIRTLLTKSMPQRLKVRKTTRPSGLEDLDQVHL